jgi:c-di-GMP-binding flagellar brake protein YcgR
MMNNERREFVRYQLKPNTIFIYSNYAPVQGWSKDICKEGMAFEYMLGDGCEPKPEIRLILTGDKFPFYLPDLVCKTIYDIEVDKDVKHNKKRYGLRRCGVKFESVDPTMQEKLTFLLNSEAVM